MAVKTYQVDPLLKLNQKRPTPRRSPTRKFLAPDQLIDFWIPKSSTPFILYPFHSLQNTVSTPFILYPFHSL